jgi:sodium/hydrogen antiporter
MRPVEYTAVFYAAAGTAALLAAMLPMALRRAPVSMPMIFLALGVLGFALIDRLPTPDPLASGEATLRLTEACVIISLMGAGLALDRPVGWHRWRTTWRLLAITMPLTMVATGLLGWWLLGVGPAAAMLLAAVLAPTDPVLASEVQVGEPTDDEDSEDEARFALTSEAGLNDSLAFPFTYAAVAMATVAAAPAAWFGGWLAVDVLWRVAVGVLVGLLIGRALARLFFARRPTLRLAEQSEGFVALACTFLAYGAAELVEGYGFVAVFVCACAIRAAERTHGYHGVLHGFIEQVERLLTVGILVLLGGAVARGLFAPLRWTDLLMAVAFLLLVRPLAGWLALVGGRTGPRERGIIAFFGVRGIGSLYYLAYALDAARFAEAERLWAVTGLVVVLSVLVHGITATPVMARVDRRREELARRRTGSAEAAPKMPV